MPDCLTTLLGGLETLMELKVIGGAPSPYACDEVWRCYVVIAQDHDIPQEYRTKALQLDHRHCGTPHGTPSPVTQMPAQLRPHPWARFGRLW